MPACSHVTAKVGFTLAFAFTINPLFGQTTPAAKPGLRSMSESDLHQFLDHQSAARTFGHSVSKRGD